jgi:N-acetylneuraminic acid mutarotase
MMRHIRFKSGGAFGASAIAAIALAACGSGGSGGTAGSNSGGSGSAASYSVGGTISGLIASGLTLGSGNNTVAVSAGASSFTLPSPVVSGASYSVTVDAQPTGLTCSVSNGSGTVNAASVTSIQVSCTANTFGLSGTISALTSSGLVLANGKDTVSVSAGITAFAFPTNVTTGVSYAVSVQTQPVGLTCQVINGSGTMGSAAITDVTVVCGQWVWEGGSDTANASGVYGTQGTPAPANVPGARSGASRWTDGTGNLWLFGGDGYGGQASAGLLNDLWNYNPSTGQWTWISGSQTLGSAGTYGTQGSPGPNNVPGGRQGAATWIDSSGNLWLFGGDGYGATAGVSNAGYLNDLWEYSPSSGQWTWVGGSNSVSGAGIPSNCNGMPCQRSFSASWTDQSGDFLLFGGYSPTSMNDLWKYAPGTNQWTLVSGTQNASVAAVYGAQGVPAAGNIPGGRSQAASWLDSSGNLWLFGGQGYDSTGTYDGLSDLWEFNTNSDEWAWIGGSQVANAANVYETQSGGPANMPGGSGSSAFATDSTGNFWLLNGANLWKYEPTANQWFWMGGTQAAASSTAGDPFGVYGTEGVPAASNTPGARGSANLWVDNSGNIWLFGGNGNATSGAAGGSLNDFWIFTP